MSICLREIDPLLPVTNKQCMYRHHASIEFDEGSFSKDEVCDEKEHKTSETIRLSLHNDGYHFPLGSSHVFALKCDVLFRTPQCPILLLCPRIPFII